MRVLSTEAAPFALRGRDCSAGLSLPYRPPSHPPTQRGHGTPCRKSNACQLSGRCRSCHTSHNPYLRSDRSSCTPCPQHGRSDNPCMRTSCNVRQSGPLDTTFGTPPRGCLRGGLSCRCKNHILGICKVNNVPARASVNELLACLKAVASVAAITPPCLPDCRRLRTFPRWHRPQCLSCTLVSAAQL